MAERPYASHPSKAFLYFSLPLARVLGSILFFLFGGLRVRGAHRVPKKGPLLVLSNHISDIDPPSVQYACPRHIRFMSKSELFKMKSVGPFMRFFGAFAVKRGEPDRGAIRLAVDYINSGQVVGMFPEGQLSETGELIELKGGVALVIRLAKCPVICLGLKNTNKMMPYGKVIPRLTFSKVEAVWGEVHHFPEGATNEEILAWIREELLTLTRP